MLECLKEWYSTYDDTLMQWNGAELMTRVIRNHSDSDPNREHLEIQLEPSFTFYPINSMDINRYVVCPSIGPSMVSQFVQLYYLEIIFCCKLYNC